jgi:hypothetical protein
MSWKPPYLLLGSHGIESQAVLNNTWNPRFLDGLIQAMKNPMLLWNLQMTFGIGHRSKQISAVGNIVNSIDLERREL